jgi:predicted ATPase/DNA-binding SARP family transcriptional activator
MADSPFPAAPPLAIRLFGAFEVQVHGRPLPPLRVRKDRWLLALLVLEQERPLSRIWLAQTLWPFPDTLESNAADNLRRSLYILRKALGDQATRLSAPTLETVALDLAGVDCDLVAFDRAIARSDASTLQTAVSLYRGDLLAECTEPWVLPAREKRRQAYCNALLDLVARARAGGDYPAARDYLHQALAADPVWEDAHRQLMEVLAQSGELNEALTLYQTLCRALARTDPMAAPDQETTALYRKLRDQARRSARSEQPPPATTLSSAPSVPAPRRLPIPLTELVGREEALIEIESRLQRARLVTLTGAGGVGKTRLALAVAETAAAHYPDGVCLTEFAALSDPRLVTQILAGALNLREQAGRPLEETLAEFLKSRRMLLVLDNCEHLLEACAQLAQALLSSAPGLRVLATSRQALGITGEVAWRVPSLSAPDPARLHARGSDTVREVSTYEAVRLFVERVEASQKQFLLTDKNALAVAQVCHHLDGIPLAIELAAACVRSLSVEEINGRLDDRFHLLTGGSRTALPRQQTLRAMMDWSYDLLTAQEKVLLHRLSVFAGGWTLAAAEAVCGGEGIEEWELLDLLTSLSDKSLALYEEREGQGRYNLLETVRQYAGERLEASGEVERVQERHLAYFLALAEQSEPHLRGPEQGMWLARLEGEHDNLRGALGWCQGQEEQAEAGLRLTTALCRFWEVRGYLSAGRAYLTEALSRVGTAERTQARAKALNGAGLLAYYQGDYGTARALHEESLAIKRELGDRQGIAQSLLNLGLMAFSQGDYKAARALSGESLAIHRELGDKRGIAMSLNILGLVADNQGDYGTAKALYEETLAINRELGHKRGISVALCNLGQLARRAGDYAQAHRLLTECLELDRQLGMKGGGLFGELGRLAADMGDAAQARRWFAQALREHRETGQLRDTAEDLEGFARLARLQSDWERAARLWGAAESLREATGTPLTPEEQKEYERDQAAVREALGEAAFEAAWSAGRAMTMEHAIEEALNAAEGP